MLTILRTTSDNKDFQQLVGSLDKELWKRYGHEQSQYDVHNKIENSKTIVIACVADEPVGCACLKPVDLFTIEIKRMYVLLQHRGKGIAIAILNELESWAMELSYIKMILETGPKQPEAITLYRKCGFDLIENYGPYADMPQSICMGKVLSH